MPTSTAIIGTNGYAGVELLRMIWDHPQSKWPNSGTYEILVPRDGICLATRLRNVHEGHG